VKRSPALLALLATACTTMEPRLGRPDPAIPASWPVGSPYLIQAEAGLPAVTFKEIFTDPRLQTLISQALANNRDLMVAASNIAAAQEQYRIQRAQQFPQLQSGASATVSAKENTSSSNTGGSGRSVSGSYQVGLTVPTFELD